MFTTLVNQERKRQIAEFIDDDHSVMDKFYEITDTDSPSDTKLLKALHKLIEIDPDFYDPYLTISEILTAQNKEQEAHDIISKAFERAVLRIVDAKGRWPKIMRWGLLENRHLMRTLDYYAHARWQQGATDEALDIYRRLLRMNQNDNQGARYNILAIRMGKKADTWEKPFETESGSGYLDAFKMIRWFNRNAKRFPDEFDYWLKEVNKESDDDNNEEGIIFHS